MTSKKQFEKWVKEQISFYKPYLDLNLQNIEVIYNKETSHSGEEY